MRAFVKRTIALGLAVLLAFPLSGCWNRKEINNIMIVLGAGIDVLPDGNVELTAQFFSPSASGGGTPSTSSPQSGASSSPGQTLVQSASGKTLAQAIDHLQKKSPRLLFWGHNKILMLGEAAAKRGVEAETDFFLRYSQTRERTRVIVCKGTAKEVLGIPPSYVISSVLGILNMVEQKFQIDRTLKDLAEGLLGESKAIALPYLDVGLDNKGKRNVEYFQGSALIKNGRMVGQLGNETSKGLLWAEGHSRWIEVSIEEPDGGGSIELSVTNSSAGLKPRIERGVWKFNIDIRANLYVIQNSTAWKLDNPLVLQQLERQINREIQQQIEETVRQLQKKNVDAFQMAQEFHRSYPREWKQAKGRWDEIFPELEVSATVHSRILRTGMANRPS